MRLPVQNALAVLAQRIDRYAGVGGFSHLLYRIAPMLVPWVRSIAPNTRDFADVLVIHSSDYVSPGKRRLIECLVRRHGLNVQQYVLGSWRRMAVRRHLVLPPYPVIARFAFKAAAARYLAERYRPKVAVISTEDTIAPFLHFEINRTGGRLINIAHSVVFTSPAFAMCDYDYYFVYGPASLDALRKNRGRFGATRVVLTGSADLSLHNELPCEDANNYCVTYFSTWIPRNRKAAYMRQFGEIQEFAMRHPNWQVVIRLHPLENPAYWESAAARIQNIRVVTANEPIAESIRGSCVALCPSHSTTALDAACLGRPPIILDCEEVGARYFDMYPALKRRPEESIESAIERVNRNKSSYHQLMTTFLAANLARRAGVAEIMSDHIAAVCHGHEISGAVVLEPSQGD